MRQNKLIHGDGYNGQRLCYLGVAGDVSGVKAIKSYVLNSSPVWPNVEQHKFATSC